jgi:nicotinamidase-related amidase
MEKRALVIIDPQNDFTALHGDYARRHAGITQITQAKTNINYLISLQPPGDTIIVSSSYQPGQFKPGLNICIPNTTGHTIDTDFMIQDEMVFITKTNRSAFSSAVFTQHLTGYQINTLILTGFLAEYCVKQTALDALRFNYKVYLADDCIGTGDDVQNRKEQTKDELTAKGAILVQSNTPF